MWCRRERAIGELRKGSCVFTHKVNAESMVIVSYSSVFFMLTTASSVSRLGQTKRVRLTFHTERKDNLAWYE